MSVVLGNPVITSVPHIILCRMGCSDNRICYLKGRDDSLLPVVMNTRLQFLRTRPRTRRPRQLEAITVSFRIQSLIQRLTEDPSSLPGGILSIVLQYAYKDYCELKDTVPDFTVMLLNKKEVGRARKDGSRPTWVNPRIFHGTDISNSVRWVKVQQMAIDRQTGCARFMFQVGLLQRKIRRSPVVVEKSEPDIGRGPDQRMSREEFLKLQHAKNIIAKGNMFKRS